MATAPNPLPTTVTDHDEPSDATEYRTQAPTRACNDAAGPQTAIVEAVVVVGICFAGALLAARVRLTRPPGWAVALGTAAAVVLAFVITWSVLGMLTS
ncbi:hypothetical protein DEI99_006710 [Curtobacterium sp. MCLR17_036]|uniref:hypothetical protein n=1 Tax=Curtobacterium sp. MCLR17_036 TaxID=2175620 RepID=UPI000DA95577|nr:hypothetical protein [Curtobacterium sp. MCLR17_036]WIE66219.1 hypothetical protein DEI99_006710 [Curtobacterium sp. MCLR17_036]